MSTDPETVAVELVAKLDNFDGRVRVSASAFGGAMKQVEQSASRAESSVTAAMVKTSRSVQQAQQASRNLGFQIADIGTQLSAGTSPFLILAQQGPQVANALEGASGAVGRMATFLSSWQGALILAAGTLAAQFIPKLLETGDGVDDLVEKLREHARSSAQSDEAQKRFADTLDGSTAALRENKEALDKLNGVQDTAAEAALELAKREEQRNIQIREGTKLLLQRAIAEAKIANQTTFGAAGGAGAGMAQAVYAGRVQELQDMLKTAEANIQEAQRQSVDAQSKVSVERGNESQEDRITRAYAKRIEDARKLAVAQGKVGAELERQVQALKNARDAEIQRIRDAETERRKAQRGSGEPTQFINPVGSGRVTGNFGEQRPGHTHAGIDIAVPIGTPVKAAAAGTVIESGTLPGYGNVVIIDHGAGTITRYAHLSSLTAKRGTTVAQGQVIGASGGARGAPGSGNSQGPHLHYEVRQNGRPVDPRKGQYATDALGAQSKAIDDMQRQAEEELRRRQAFANELATLQGGELDARQALIAAAEEIAQLEIQSIEVARKKYDDNLDALVAQGKLHADEAKQLRDINDERAKLRTELVQRREDERKFRMQEAAAQEKLQFQSDSYAVEEELVRSQEGVAKTAKERQRLGQRLIDLQFDEERIQNDALIQQAKDFAFHVDQLKTERQIQRDKEIADLEALKLQGKLNDEQAKRLDYLKSHPPLLSDQEQHELNTKNDRATIAQGRNDTLDQRKANAQQGNAEQNASPIQHWMDEVPQKADEINQAFENIAAGGLTTFADGLADAIVNFKSLGDVARAVIQSMLSDLIKLIAKMLIVKALKAIFGGFADGGAVGKGFNSDKGVKFASGGPVGFPSGGLVMGDGTATSDSIPARLSNGEFVIRKKAVDGLGLPFLNQINHTGRLPLGFAGGGALQAVRPNNTPAAAPGSTGAATLSPEAVRQLEGVVTRAAAAMPAVNLFPTLDPGDVLHAGLGSTKGRRALFDFASTNSGRFKKAIG
jgi:murein DD-endopeptidase MepM/ murein hydrolase activator NlpD